MTPPRIVYFKYRRCRSNRNKRLIFPFSLIQVVFLCVTLIDNAMPATEAGKGIATTEYTWCSFAMNIILEEKWQRDR